MIGTMLKSGGTVALSLGALVTAGTMNLVVLNGGPAGPGNLVLQAAAGTTSTSQAPSHPAHLTAVDGTTSTTAEARQNTVRPAPGTTTSTAGSTTTTGVEPHQPTTTTTRPPGTTTTTTKPHQNPPPSVRVFVVHDAGRVRVHWVKAGHTISATAVPNDGWTLPHATKQGPNVTLRFQSKTELVVWHAWVEAAQIKAWVKTYNL
jgi:cytoskeletal protein RodZ